MIKIGNVEAISGAHSYALYAKETTYNTPVSVTTHLSSLVQSFKGNINNNSIGNYAFSGSSETDGRKIFNYTHGVLELTGSAEMKVTNFAFMEYVCGTKSGGGPYTYTVAAIPPSFTLATDIDNPGSAATDQEATFSGGVIESLGLKTSVGQPVMATLDMKFGKVIIDTTLSSRVALPTEGAYTFAGGSIELPASSILSNIIDSIDLSIKNQYEIYYGLSRLAVRALPKGLQISVKVSLKYLDNALYTAALGATTPTATGGPTEYATMVLNFRNTDGDTFKITLSKVPLTEFSQIHQLQNPVTEDLTFTAADISCLETLA